MDFLVETSVLEMFDAELCAAVTGVADAALVLDRLLAANLFLVPLDDPVRWFRYHHLFGAFLRARLASLGQGRVRAAHARASEVLEGRGDVSASLRHAMAIGDADRAGRILRTSISSSMGMPDVASDAIRAVRLWLHEEGEACVESDPVWVLELLIGLMGLARPQEATVWLERIQRAHPEADGPLTTLIEGTWNEHHQTHGQPIAALRHLDRAGEAVGWRPPNVGLVSLLWVTKGRAHIQAGEFELAEAALEEGHRHPVGNVLADEARNRGVAAYVAAVQGELRRAADLARAATDAADGLGLGGHELGRVYAALAAVEQHIERHELERASDASIAARAAVEANRRVNVQSLALLQEAQLAQALGDEAQSSALLVQAGLWFDDPDEALRRVLAEEAIAQALRFDPAGAAALIEELEPGRTTTQVLRARLALLDGDDRMAASILDVLPPATSRRTRVERDVLRALSVLGRDVDRANEHLGSALDAGQPEGLVRTFIEHGPDVHKLLLSFTPSSAQERYVDRLLAVASQGVAPIRMSVVQELVDPLSARELTVLRYLCSRLTYVEIAGALYVSINTLKSHVRTVYRKLAVASRADAVAAGRELGLI